MNHFGLSRSRRCDNNNVAIAPKSFDLKIDEEKIEGLKEGILPIFGGKQR